MTGLTEYTIRWWSFACLKEMCPVDFSTDQGRGRAFVVKIPTIGKFSQKIVLAGTCGDLEGHIREVATVERASCEQCPTHSVKAAVGKLTTLLINRGSDNLAVVELYSMEGRCVEFFYSGVLVALEDASFISNPARSIQCVPFQPSVWQGGRGKLNPPSRLTPQIRACLKREARRVEDKFLIEISEGRVNNVDQDIHRVHCEPILGSGNHDLKRSNPCMNLCLLCVVIGNKLSPIHQQFGQVFIVFCVILTPLLFALLGVYLAAPNRSAKGDRCDEADKERGKCLSEPLGILSVLLRHDCQASTDKEDCRQSGNNYCDLEPAMGRSLEVFRDRLLPPNLPHFLRPCVAFGMAYQPSRGDVSSEQRSAA